MDSVITYQDYRAFMQQWFAEKKARSAMTWREFAKLAGFKSPVYLKLVCEGKSSLRGQGVLRVARAMGLEGFELAYFKSMVAFNHANRETIRQKHFDEMQALAKAHKVNVLGQNSMSYFELWQNPVLRELVPHMPGKKPKQIAVACMPKISARQVSETLKRLTDMGLLKKVGKDTFKQTSNTVSTGKMDFVPLAVQQMHLQMGNFALDAIKNVPLSERSVSGLTLGLTQKTFQKIEKELADFRKRIIAIATEDDEMERVYRLNLQLFPLSWNIKSKKD
jgi:uncharacterized protein (TIGR02147 family)